MSINESEASGMIKTQGVEEVKMDDFKYPGSTIQSTGLFTIKVEKRV